MVPSIVDELDRLGERVALLARVTLDLRAQNEVLQKAVEQRDGENGLLHQRLDAARERLEALIERLPTGD